LIGPLSQLTLRPLDFLREMRDRHGDIYTLDLGVLRVAMLNNARHIQHVLVDHAANYSKGGAMWDSVRDLLGNGLPASEGAFWLRQRRMMQPHFHRKRLSGLAAQIVTATQESLAAWDVQMGKPFNIASAFSPITMRVITRLLFGQALSPAAIDEVGGAMAYMVNYVMLGALTRDLPSWMPRPGARRFQQAKTQADHVINMLVERQRREQLADDTLLAMLVDMVDTESGDTMTTEQLRDEAISMFLAGYETTSLTLAWLFYYLTHHPEVETRLRAEVDAVLGDRPPTFEDLPQLGYTRNVIQETLRLRPAAWWVTRTAVEADEIDNFSIPAGSLVGTVFYGVHQNPAHWEHPERFDPDRFTPERSSGRHKYAWVPFGAGQRQCIGKDLALMEAQIILAMILQRYRFTSVPSRAGARATGTLGVKGAVTLTLQRR
jgi:cytochrome P450